MAVTIGELADRCAAAGLRHHLDAADQAIRVALVTRAYVNARAERLAIVRVEATGHGTHCRVVLERAFATGRHPAATCLAICDATGDVPFVRVEHDATSHSLRLVAELPVEDGTMTPRQLFALIDAVAAAAEAGQAAIAARRRGRGDAGARRVA
ncbi:MAG: hypothetical protein ACKO1M_07915 [Planctomycetota bacterium]